MIMTSSKMKKLLLAGTAIVAVTAFSASAHAADLTLSADGTWASAAGANSTPTTDVTNAAASDNVDITADATLTIVTNNAADDGSANKGTFAIGDITDTGTGVEGNVAIAAGAYAGANSITIASADVAGTFSVAYATGLAATGQTVAITDDLTVGGTLSIVNSEAAAAEAQAVTVGGDLAVTGASTLTAGGVAGASTALTVTGDAAFTGGMIVTGGSVDATADATLTLNGEAVSGQITLTDGAAGQALLVLNGAADQTVSSKILGDGDITVTASGTEDVDFTAAVTSGTISIGTTGTVSFASTLASALTFTAAGTAELAGDLTGSINFANTASEVVLADGVDVSSTIDSTAGANGTLTIEGTSTITGIVGGTNAISLISAGADDETVTFSAATKATTLNFTGDGAVVVGGAYTGAVTTTTDGEGSLTLNGASAGVTTIGTALKALGKVALGADVTTSGAVYADELNLNGSFLTTGANYTLASGQTLATTLTGVIGTSGDMAVTGDAALASGSTILVDINDAYLATIADGVTYDLIVASGAATSAATVVSYVPGYTFTAAVTGGDTVTLTADEKAASAWTNDDYAYEQIISSAGATEIALQAAVVAATTQAEKDALIEAAQPAVDGSAQVTAMDVATQVQGITDTRIASLRVGDISGMAAGDEGASRRLWMQGFYNSADQNERSGIEGYNSNTGGVVIGLDTDELVPGAVVGMAVNYGNTVANSDNAAQTDTDITSYGLTAYMSKDLGADMFVNAQAGYARNEIEITNYTCGGAGLVCSGDTNSDQFSAKVGLGRDFEAQQGMIITPSLYSSYVTVQTDGYTETGTGTVKTVQDNDVDALDVGVDLAATWEIQGRDGMMKPSINVGYAYDVIGDEIETVSTFVGGGSAFRTTGAEAAQNKFKAGVGFVYETDADWEVAAKYDAVMKEDYYSHNGTLRLTTHF